MKKISFFWVFCLISFNAFAAQKTILCDSPLGTRVDYFTRNSVNIKNETFQMSKDGMTGVHPQIILNDNNQNVSLIIGDAQQIKSPPKKGNMKVLAYDDEQISFTGIVNGAPIMATYYPQMSILIYSQQSTWSNENFQGARAVMFFSKCK